MNPTTGAARVEDTARRGRAERDGCDCPDYVTRCAHLPQGRLWYISAADATAEAKRRNLKKHQDTFLVMGPGWMEKPRGPDSTHLCVPGGRTDLFRSHNSDADALAAFYEAERTLLAQDADGRAVQGEPGEETR